MRSAAARTPAEPTQTDDTTLERLSDLGRTLPFERAAERAVEPGFMRVDRASLLDELSRHVASAWSSFDVLRTDEPELDERLRACLSETLPPGPGSQDRALADAVGLLDASPSPGRPSFAAYIGSTGLEAGVAGSVLASTYDINLASRAGAAELIEQQTLAWVGEFIGVPHRHGTFTAGGMTSNLTALLAARERSLPGARVDGFDGRSAAVYCSAEAHASVTRAVETMGLGRRNLRRIPIDDHRRLRTDELGRALARDRRRGVVPIAVVATAGTTLTGAVDPIAQMADVCADQDVWLHVDGAYGLPAAATRSAGGRFAGIDRADSLTIDAHKWLGMPKSCSVILVRDEAALGATFGHHAGYLPRFDGRSNPVDRTLEYSRPLRSLKLWLAFRIYGAAQFRAWIEGTLRLARHLAELVEDADDLELVNLPELSTVCFRHLPGRGADGQVDAHNLRLANAIQRDGRVYLAAADVDGRSCLRATLVNFRTMPDDVARLVRVVRELGSRLAADEVVAAPSDRMTSDEGTRRPVACQPVPPWAARG